MPKSKSNSKKLWRIHSWVGLYAGIAIAVLSVTGVLALFKVEIDQAINPKYFKIDPPDSTATIHPDFNKIVDSLKLAYGPGTFGGITPSVDPSKSWQVNFFVKDKNIDFAFIHYEAFINPYTAQLIGVRNYFKTFGHYIRHIHVRLFNGLLGRFFVGFAGLALLISTVTGILIYGGFMKRQFFGAIRNKNLKLKSADYHKVVGMTTLLFNLMIAITGAWLGLQSLLQPVLQVKSPVQYKRTEKLVSKEADIAYAVDYIKAYETSRKLFPDLTPTSITASKSGSQTIIIKGDVPQTAYQKGANRIVLDKKDYAELGRYDIREKPLHDKVYYAQEGLHYGDFGGIWVKVIYTILGLTSGVLAMLGFVLYLERTKSRQKQKANYKTTGKKVWSWSIWVTLICILLYVTTAIIGRDIPTYVITIAMWGALLFFLIKYMVVYTIRGVKALKKRQA